MQALVPENAWDFDESKIKTGLVGDDGSMKTFIKDGETGFFVDKGSALQICRTLVELIGNIEKIRTVSFNARKFITDNFAIDSYIDSLSNIYTTVLTK